MALCALVTLYLFAGYTVRPTWPRAAVAALVCTLGMMSKEGMVVVPLLVWLYDRIFVSGSWTEAWRRHRRAHLALAATWLPLIGLMATSHLANRGVGFDGEIGAGQYLLLQSRAVLLYLRLAVWPEGLVFDRGWPVPVTLAAATPALLAVVALLAGTAVALRRWPVVGFAAAWWWLALAPTSSFVPILEQPVAENRVYLPLSGLLALGVLGLDRGLRHRWPLLLAAATVLVSTLGLLTARRTRDFRTEVELWRTTVAAQPDNARAQAHFGAALLRAGRVEDSAAASAAALQLRPQYPDAAVNLGIARLQQGRSAEAVSLLETVVRRAPRHVEARYNLGLALAHHRRDAEAIAHLEAVLHLQPQHAAAHNNLSALLLPLGRASEAAAQARSALAVAPTSPEAHYNLGNALARLGDPAGAIRAFEEALRWQPDFARAHNNLGVVHLQAGRPAEARAHFEAALRARPDYPEARRNLEALRPP
jgi:Flp pilus assembly protein TadD